MLDEKKMFGPEDGARFGGYVPPEDMMSKNKKELKEGNEEDDEPKDEEEARLKKLREAGL